MSQIANKGTEQLSSTEQSLPNKFLYPEFAGFQGEKLMRRLVKAILPLSLYRTWETFEEEHAYDNDCFLSLTRAARDARRTQRTVTRNIATLLSRGLLVLRSEYKLFCRSDGSAYKKAVVIKDFSGLYTLAHEYYEWQYAEDYLAPEYEYIEHIQQDPHLLAKLCRFDDYRRLLEHHRDPFAQIQKDPRFTSYRAEKQVEDAFVHQTDSQRTKNQPKEGSTITTKVSYERIKERVYNNRIRRESSDSEKDLEREKNTTILRSTVLEPVILNNKEEMQNNTAEKSSDNEFKTCQISARSQYIPPSAGKTCENYEGHIEKQQEHTELDTHKNLSEHFIQHQAREQQPPAKHALARSFVHEVASLFGDQNEKSSKTGIERYIETFALEHPADILQCLVRAYVAARDTRAEKIRHRCPDGSPNRMPLFCSMFGRFAQGHGPGSQWQYPWEQMLEDIAADDRLKLWISQHPLEFIEDRSDQTNKDPIEQENNTLNALREPDAHEGGQQVLELPGWPECEIAYEHGVRLMQAVVDANYSGIEIALRERSGRFFVVYKVLGDETGELILKNAAQIAFMIERARQKRL